MSTCTCHAIGPSERLAHDLTVGASALAEGDLPHALHHLAAAVGEAPMDPAVEALRLAVCARGGGPATAADGAYYGEVALVAMGHADAGSWSDAVRLLGQVACMRPDVGFEHLLTRWLTEAGETLSEGAALTVAQAITTLGETTVGLHRLYLGERALLLSWAETGRALVACRPSPQLLYAVPGLFRRVGWMEASLELARTIGEGAAIQEALTLRVMGDGEGAARIFQRLGEYPIEEARCWLLMDEVGVLDAFQSHAGDPEVARIMQSIVLGRHPDDPLELMDEACRRTRAGPLQAPPDATANLLRQASMQGVTSLQTAVRGWESPSNRLAVALWSGTDLVAAGYTQHFDDDPQRSVLAQTRGHRSLWRADGDGVVPAVPAPPEVLLSWLVERRAGLLGEVDACWNAAERAPEGSAAEWVAAMVHAPRSLDLSAVGVDALFHYQVLAAMCAARRPWSEARPALVDALFGPLDWAGAAAVIAVCERARHDAAVAMDARALLAGVADDLGPYACEPRADALLVVYRTLPGVPATAWAQLEAWWTTFRSDDATTEEPTEDDLPQVHEPTQLVAATPAGATPSRPSQRRGVDALGGSVSSGMALWVAVLVALGLAAWVILR